MGVEFSFIVPVYGVESYLRQCVDSILGQSFRDVEVILVDDGSPDGSWAICDEYAAADPRVRVIHQMNAGAAAARNVAMGFASGEFVIFVDGDDFLLGHGVLHCVHEALSELHPDVLVVGHEKYWDGDPVLVQHHAAQRRTHDLAWMMRHDVYLNAPWDKVARRSLLVDSGIQFPEDLRTSDDAVWSSELLLATDRIVHTPIKFYGYRQRLGSITASSSASKLADLQTIFDQAAERLGSCNYPARRKAYGAYFARFLAFLMAATSHDATTQNLEFLAKHLYLLPYACSRRARMTRAAVLTVGLRQTVRMTARAQRFIHRRRSSAGAEMR
ncbi:glycosyltransferase [Microbacterium ulmi]|uniref:Glycosyltransferase n=1 Tax=Microbacterium ulmi TaxID=179095 RepID=A0A7Y2PZC3_9MICO|nr:glycosyltransferase involved in cell wall biosynthesis [Microbacterium ulmi]NNH04301.1 glycosyltransferase [Microbacterium ulmi]